MKCSEMEKVAKEARAVAVKYTEVQGVVKETRKETNTLLSVSLDDMEEVRRRMTIHESEMEAQGSYVQQKLGFFPVT